MEDACTGAAGGGAAGEGDDGEAHPEGVAGGGDAVVGEGVEADVDVVVGAEILASVAARGELDAVGGDAVRFESGEDAGAVGVGDGLDEDLGIGDGAKDLGPEL